MTSPPSWRRGLDPIAVQRVREIVAIASMEDGVAPMSGHLLDTLGSPDDHYLLAEAADRIVAVAARHDQDPAELVVEPAARRRGIGRTMLAAVLDVHPRVWAHGDLTAARSLAASTGLRPVRTLLQMRRPLPVPSHTTAAPQGFRIRTFVRGQDEEQFLAVNARAFSWHPEQSRLDSAGLAVEMAQHWFDPGGFFLAVDRDDRILGFHWTKVHPVDPTPQAGSGSSLGGSDPGGSSSDTSSSDTSSTVGSRPSGREPVEVFPVQAPAAGLDGPVGEVFVLGVDPLSPVRGLGTPLTLVGLDHLAALGLRTVMLYVEGDNERASALYRRLGFSTVITDRVYSRG
jgi:mycothiol synthase